MAGSQVWRTPRRPSTISTSTSGTNRARIGVCRPTIDPSVPSALASESRGSLLTPEAIGASVTIGIASAPKATGAVFATSATVAALTGLNPSDISMTTEIATGVPKPGEGLEQRTEAEGDDDRLDPLVGADLLERAAQHLEVAGRHGEVVDPHRVDHDPQDREEAEEAHR